MASSRDYTNGRIYKILNHVDDECYVGSTCQSSSKRMAEHRAAFNEPKKQHYTLYTKMKEYGIENFYIELIEAYPCENNEELRKREGHYIREFGTLNKLIAGRTQQECNREYHQTNREKKLAQMKEYHRNNREKEHTQRKEYRQNHREQILAREKEYREVHRERISERKKATYTCVCGTTCRMDVKAKHERTSKHQAFITNLDVPTQTES